MPRPRRWSVPFVISAVVGLFAVAVLATNYPKGGGLEWGGRFFSPALAPLAALAAVALLNATKALGSRSARVLIGGLVALVALVPTAFGLALLHRYRVDKDVFYNELAARASALVLIDGPLPELPRTAWRLDPQVRWLWAEDRSSANRALAALHQHGVQEVTLLKLRGDSVVTGAPYADVADVSGPKIREVSWQLLRLRA
jgi:hypothetical protein